MSQEYGCFTGCETSQISETQLVGEALKWLTRRLPPGWSVRSVRDLSLFGDATIEVRSPDNKAGEVVVEAKRRVEPQDAARLVDAFAGSLPVGRSGLVVAPYLSDRSRELLVGAGLNYLDSTGNARLVLERPGLFVETRGADRSPTRDEPRPLRSLRGRGAGRAVRALCEFRPPFGIRDLAARSDTPAPTLSRVVELLDREALLTREGARGPVTDVDWRGTIRRWTKDYTFTKSNATTTYLAPRGLPALLTKLKQYDAPYAVTAGFAASKKAPVAPPRLMAIYVTDRSLAAESLDLRPTERGANVLLAEPFDPIAFERTWRDDGVTYASVAQVVADLLTSPGRSSEEADGLMRWMGDDEDAWRAD